MKYQAVHAIIYLAFSAATTLSVGCSGKPTATKTANSSAEQASATIVAGIEPNEEQRQAMLGAQLLLFQRLSGRLMQAMGEQGPAAAITVCQTEAPQIAADVSEQQGLSIGRTGVRLRNPNNQPPAWAKPLTDQKTDTPTFVTLSNGQAAALLPIKLQGTCLMCHGPKEQIAPLVAAQLAKLYPDDQATGFQEGELRGWFWIELPAGKKEIAQAL